MTKQTICWSLPQPNPQTEPKRWKWTRWSETKGVDTYMAAATCSKSQGPHHGRQPGGIKPKGPGPASARRSVRPGDPLLTSEMVGHHSGARENISWHGGASLNKKTLSPHGFSAPKSEKETSQSMSQSRWSHVESPESQGLGRPRRPVERPVGRRERASPRDKRKSFCSALAALSDLGESNVATRWSNWAACPGSSMRGYSKGVLHLFTFVCGNT